MGCDTCKSECGREDGCGTRKATQKVVLDGLAERLYPSRTWGQADDAACFRAGLSLSEVQRLGRQVAAAGEPERREPDKCVRWAWFDWAALPTPLFAPVQHLVDSGFVPGAGA